MTTDEWVTAALTDDAVVAELLFRLKQSSESFASKPAGTLPPLVLPVGWGHRQPRSKPAADRKERESTRYSPTTPLSWSCGGGSAASPGDGCDEPSLPSDHSSGGRSKGIFTVNDTSTAATVAATSSKRSRRKKTFAELREEESSLLRERTHLKKEIATLRTTLEEQKARSETLKKIKLDLNFQSEKKMSAISNKLEALNSGPLNLAEVSTISTGGDSSPHTSCNVEKEVETRERCFILPDLNIMPFEENAGCETFMD